MSSPRTDIDAAKRWYLVFTKPRQEKLAKVNLERQGFVSYLPMVRQYRRRSGRRILCVEPLFPRYLFIHLDTVSDNWSPIRSTIGVSALVRFGTEPAVVPDDLVTTLRERDDDAGVQAIRLDNFKPGERVRIGEGPMTGYEGLYLARNSRERVTVLLEIVGRQARVLTSLDHLERAD